MTPRFTPNRPGSWVAALLLAITPALAQPAPAAPRAVQNDRPIFQQCRTEAGATRLAIRRMEIDGQPTRLLVDPTTLATSLAPDQTLSCTETTNAQFRATPYLQAIANAAATPDRPPPVIANGGLQRGPGTGAYLTADLCPSRRKLDRAFLQNLLHRQSPLPIALSVSGTWLTHHQADFQWLRAQQQTGALSITWVDHSYHHPYIPGRANAENFLLTPGTDIQAEILDTEKLLIAQGEIPSVFFRFPGLIANAALMRAAAQDHLVVLGAAAWLARTPQARPGDIILIHLNGNEPQGLRIFTSLQAAGQLPSPFNPLVSAAQK
jgi:hypothetical protein